MDKGKAWAAVPPGAEATAGAAPEPGLPPHTSTDLPPSSTRGSGTLTDSRTGHSHLQ